MSSLSELGKKAAEDLRKKGIDLDRLAIVLINGGEQLIGQVEKGDLLVGDAPIHMFNPKRFARLQQVTPQGLNIQFIIGDLDMMESGMVVVKPLMGYWLTWMGKESVESVLALYTDFLRRKQENSARAAGLELPGPGGFVRAPR